MKLDVPVKFQGKKVALMIFLGDFLSLFGLACGDMRYGNCKGYTLTISIRSPAKPFGSTSTWTHAVAVAGKP